MAWLAAIEDSCRAAIKKEGHQHASEPFRRCSKLGRKKSETMVG